jgi:hypothetical protein
MAEHGFFINDFRWPSHIQVAVPPPDTLSVPPPVGPEPLYKNRGDEPMPEPRSHSGKFWTPW